MIDDNVADVADDDVDDDDDVDGDDDADYDDVDDGDDDDVDDDDKKDDDRHLFFFFDDSIGHQHVLSSCRSKRAREPHCNRLYITIAVAGNGHDPSDGNTSWAK